MPQAQPQASPPFQQNAPPEAPAPAPAPAAQPQQQQQQPIVVVVAPQKKGYGHGGYDDNSGYGVKVIKASAGDSSSDEHENKPEKDRYRDKGDKEEKGRSLSYTIRIPQEKSVSYGKPQPRRQRGYESDSNRRPTTFISQSNKGRDIYTSGSRPKEIYLDIGPNGKVRTSRGRFKRSLQQTVSNDASNAGSEDVHYFFHIQHVDGPAISNSDQPRPAGYGRRDYSVPDTRPLSPPPAPPSPSPPASDQPITQPQQVVQAVVPSYTVVQSSPVAVQASPVFQQSPAFAVQANPVFQAAPIYLASPPVQQSPAFNIPVRISLAPKPAATVHHYYVPKKKKFKKLKKSGWMWY
jgi:hypothetical protein